MLIKKIYIYLLVLVILNSCKVVPIHLASISSTEKFTQNFNLLGTNSDSNYRRLVGENHYNKYHNSISKLEVADGGNKFHSKGNLNVKYSISKDKKSFIIEGSGSYIIYTKASGIENNNNQNKLFYRGLFDLIDTKLSLNVFDNFNYEDNKVITVPFKQHLIHYFQNNNSSNSIKNTQDFYEITIYAHVKIKKTHKKQFSINYDENHLISFDKNGEEKIGYLKFNSEENDHNIIDLKGLKYIKKYR
ncbi:hypothetical protein [Flammeovirga sp. OC4]|uniref:hypothetical protein n=1 Tax=Flammeovirga sp. OC4 TaxID=1382345 RepID=UPI0005C7A57F|nr:hypothetical protein [Flammeovirga sp. OC4]